MLRNPRLSACCRCCKKCLQPSRAVCYLPRDRRSGYSGRCLNCMLQSTGCMHSERSERVVKLRAAINMSVSPHFAQDSCATSRSSKLRHIDLGHLMPAVRRFYAGICTHLLSFISTASDAHCDGLPLSSSYELTGLGSDSISGLVLKPFDPVRITTGEETQKTKGREHREKTETCTETGNHANSDRYFWSAMTRFLVCS